MTDKTKSFLRIKINAYDHKIIDQASKKITDVAYRYGSDISGPFPLPTHIKKFVVNRSPFIDEDSQEHYEVRVHKRLIDIFLPTPQLVNALTNITLPTGVDIEVKSITA
ncbi:MAG: 30S ribosomal protein S10 [Patescibacteria group bacterium]